MIVPHLDVAPCSAALAMVSNVSCYTLTEPEDRANPVRAISTPIVVRRALNGSRADHAVFFSVGGPGSQTMYRIEHKVNGVPLVRTHDVVWFEQRGNVGTTPSLDCPEYTAAHLAVVEGNLSHSAAARAEIAAAQICRARFTAAGIDLAAFNTESISRDLIDLASLLGYKQMDLYGLSYSGAVMLETLRLKPSAVRSLFIDSPLSLDERIDESALTNQYRAFDEAFGGDDAPLRTLLAMLKSNPINASLKTPEGAPLAFKIDGRAAFNAIANLLYDPASVASIPKIVAAANARDDAALISNVQANISPSFFAWGQRLSVWCHDYAPFDDSARVFAEDSRYPELAGLDSEVVPAPVCAAWNVGSAPRSITDPIRSSTPSLLYGGQFDPNLPPAWTQRIADSLSRSTVVIFRGMSHGAGETPCGWKILEAFIDDPSTKPDTSCAL